METIGKITNIKVGSFLPGAPTAFDVANISLKEAGTGRTWLFYIWNSRENEAAFRRVLHSQRLALAREAAFRKLTVHVFHENDSSLIDQLTVDLP